MLLEESPDPSDGLGDERGHPRPGVLVEAREIEDPFEASGDRMLDRYSHAGESAERLGIVLLSADPHGAPFLGGGAHPIGAHHVLGIGVTGHQADLVEQVGKGTGAGTAVEHAGTSVGEDHRGARVGQGRCQAIEHRRRQVGQAAARVGACGHGRGQHVAVDTRP